MLACVAIFLGIIFTTKDKADAPNGGSSSQLTNHVTGNGKSGVVLIEYGDFNCSACFRYYPIVKQVKEKYKDDIIFQFRHYPLVELHQNALVGARAAEAAGLQGKFWEMHDILFENFLEWEKTTNPSSFFEEYAKQIGLDVEKFRQDSKSEQVNDAVQADRAEAKRLEFGGTPTFVLDGKKVELLPTMESFETALNQAIQARGNNNPAP